MDISVFIDSFASGLLFGVPAFCALCHSQLKNQRERKMGVCDSCVNSLLAQMSSVCEICGIPLWGLTGICPVCRGLAGYLDAQRSAGLYAGNLKIAVQAFKYGGQRWLARPLAKLISRAAAKLLPVDLIIPVPIDPSSLTKRGFNQAEDLAYHLAKHLDVPFQDVLAREGRQTHQAELSRVARMTNLEGSMELKAKADVLGLRILVVDDVMTTGATLDEAARVLKSLGGTKVYGGTVARTPRQQ